MKHIATALLIFFALVLGPISPVAAAASTAPIAETVATGLDNPRGLVLLGNHTLAVAEAGHAGPVCLAPGQCMGLNGQVTILRRGERDRTVVASGLPSFSGPFGAFGLGGVTVQQGKLYFVVGLNPQSFGDPTADCQGQADASACITTVSAVQAQSGFLSRVESLQANRGWQNIASVGKFDLDYAAMVGDPGNVSSHLATPTHLASSPVRPAASTLSTRRQTRLMS